MQVLLSVPTRLSTDLSACFRICATRSRFWTGLFIALLLLAVTAQMWLGILLLFDSHHGPVTGFAA
jgi:hypothetical protein